MSAIPNSADARGQKALEIRDDDSSSITLEIDLAQKRGTNPQFDEDKYMLGLQRLIAAGQRDDHGSEAPVHEYAFEIYRHIQDGLGPRMIDKKQQRLRGTKDILAEDDDEYVLDDCVRWLILLRAVEDYELNDNGVFEEAIVEGIHHALNLEMNPNIIIIDIITEIAPYLAFETLNRRRSYDPKIRCKLPDVHARHLKNIWTKKTPFHRAAERGHYKAIDHMIRHGSTLWRNESDQNQHDEFIKVLKRPISDREKVTALSLAATAEEGSLETVKTLLSFDPEIAAPPDATFGYALDGGMVEVVNVFLQYDYLRDLFATPEYILQAINLCSAQVEGDGNQPQINIASSLLAHTIKSNVINDEIIEKMIKVDFKEFCEMIRQSRMMPSSDRFLHLAVRYQSVNFVEMFLHENPESCVQRWEDHYPLWHNNFTFNESYGQYQQSQVGPNRGKIRDMLVSATIKSRSLFTIRDILDIFHQSGGMCIPSRSTALGNTTKIYALQANPIFRSWYADFCIHTRSLCLELTLCVVSEICLDLSGFKSTAYPMSDLFRGLMYQQDHTALLSYESIIKYAEFPALALVTEEKKTLGNSVQTEHTEIFDVLDWLQSSKGVKGIVELIVIDRLFNPHDEVRIGQYVRNFSIEILNWKLLDMSISIFEDQGTKENIRELYLYASGKRAVISHWLSEEGIRSLPNLTTLEIYVVQNLMTKENCKKTFEYIYIKFSELCDKINEGRSLDDREELFVNVNIQEWDPTDEEKLPELEETSERVVPKLSQFTKKYYNYVQDLANFESRIHRPTRVAVIDNGVLGISPNAEEFWDLPNTQQPFDARRQKARHEHSSNRNTGGRWSNNKTLFSRIKEGQSFVDDGNRVSQWFLASDPHGTQMARLICSIDPCCDLYVARVSKGRSGIIPARVARAIRWAISKEVDIISMSFAIRELTEELREACHQAAARGIAMLCSAHDEGSNLMRAYPADFPETITITTCDEFGTVAPRSRHQNYEYAVYSQEVAVGIVPFLESDEYISGSSVATAIAAGLGSLVLSCGRLAQQEEDLRRDSRGELLKHHFQQMVQNETKFLQPERFAGIDRYINDGRDINVEFILHQVFGKVRL